MFLINLKERMPAVFTRKNLDEVPGSSFNSTIIEELGKSKMRKEILMKRKDLEFTRKIAKDSFLYLGKFL